MSTIVVMFQRRFALKIIEREKNNTMRRTRKRPIKVGDVLSLRCWKDKPYRSGQDLLRDTVCTGISEITITATNIIADSPRLMGMLKDDFARSDGFADFAEMRDWFQKVHGLPFTGTL